MIHNCAEPTVGQLHSLTEQLICMTDPKKYPSFSICIYILYIYICIYIYIYICIYVYMYIYIYIIDFFQGSVIMSV